MKEIFSEYSQNDIITILSGLDKDKQDRILQRCSNPAAIAIALNAIIKTMCRVCNTAEKLLSDDIMSAVIGSFYLEYTHSKEQEAKQNIKIKKECVPKDIITVRQDGVNGFYIGDIFIGVI